MTVLAASSCSGVKVSDGCGPDGVTDFDGREDETSEDGDSEDGDSEDGDNETGLPDPDTLPPEPDDPPAHDTSTETTAATAPTRHATIRLITQHLHWCHKSRKRPLRPGTPPTLEPHTTPRRQQRETLTKS